MKNNLLQRTLTGFLLVSLIVVLVLFGNLLFNAFMLAVVLGCTYELHAVIQLTNKSLKGVSHLISGAVFVFVSMGGYSEGHFAGYVPGLLALLVIVPLFASLFINKPDAISQAFKALVPALYIALPLGLVPLFGQVVSADTTQPVMVLSLFILIWVSDTFAYLVGISIGRHRLFERISPKKSWEGALGGCVFSLLAAWVLFSITGLMSLPVWLGLAVIVVIFGIFGDLFESLLKRTAMMKDSGSLLPGHGGLLDRFDALLFVSPAAWVYLTLVLS